MDFLEKILGQRLMQYIPFFILALFLIIFPEKFPLHTRTVGILILILSSLYIIYESQLRYYIKFKKSNNNFKSNRESFIATYFDKKHIKYLYEKSLKLGSQLLHPDFYLPEFDVYVEYWGRWGDFEYNKTCNHKRHLYEKYGIELIELYPDNLVSINQLDWKFTERLLNILKKNRK